MADTFLPLRRAFVCVPYTPYGVGNERTDGGGNNHVGRIMQAEQQSRTGNRRDKRDSADDRPAEEHTSSVCTPVIFSVGKAFAREITWHSAHSLLCCIKNRSGSHESASTIIYDNAI